MPTSATIDDDLVEETRKGDIKGRLKVLPEEDCEACYYYFCVRFYFSPSKSSSCCGHLIRKLILFVLWKNTECLFVLKSITFFILFFHHY